MTPRSSAQTAADCDLRAQNQARAERYGETRPPSPSDDTAAAQATSQQVAQDRQGYPDPLPSAGECLRAAPSRPRGRPSGAAPGVLGQSKPTPMVCCRNL